MSTASAPARWVAIGALACAAGCSSVPGGSSSGVSSFQVSVDHVFFAGTRNPLDVMQPCADRYGGTQAAVPEADRGTDACPYSITSSAVDFEVSVIAVDSRGQEVDSFTAPLAFRAVPGDLALSYQYRFMNLIQGRGRGLMRASHQFAQMRLWVEDAPPEPLYDGGTVIPGAPAEPTVRTYATGVSPEIRFEDPTIQKLQTNINYSTLGVPFDQQFVQVGRVGEPDAGAGQPGDVLRQNCPGDPVHDQQPAQMVVTGIDCCGFFAEDVAACTVPEDNNDTGAAFRIPEPPPGNYPGTFSAIYVYNYSHPDGLDVGDLLWSISGSVQEFTGTTQLTFASWAVEDHVRLRPSNEWDLYLQQVPTYDISLRTCGMNPVPFIEDTLCANSRSALKMESLESSLVRLRNVKLPDAFPNCDLNDDGTVPFFCSYSLGSGLPRAWGICPFGDVSLSPTPQELQCYIDCTNSLGSFVDRVCTEGSAFLNYSQITVELAGYGPAWAGFDETIPGKVEQVQVTSTAANNLVPLPVASRGRFICDGAVRYRMGTSGVAADQTDPIQPAGQLYERTLPGADDTISLVNATGSASDPPVNCWVSFNPRVRFLATLSDAAPALKLNCSPSDPDPVAAEQCRFLQAARYDITGHLRQVQPARPRWMVLPRDLDDLCCHPGPGMQCPTPIKPCP